MFPLQCENIGGLLHPLFFKEQFDLLLAQAFDIEGSARDEQHQMLNLLIRTGELASTAGARALLAGRGLLAHDVRMEVTRTLLRKMIGLGVLRTLVDDDVHDLRNDVAGTLNDYGVADADIAAVPQWLAVATNALDVVFIVQRDVLHDHTAHPDGIEFADGRQRSGPADLNLDILEYGHRAFGRKFMRDCPARRTRHETESLLPIDAVDLVDDAVDVVVELGALLLDLAMEGDEFLGRAAQFRQRIGLEAASSRTT